MNNRRWNVAGILAYWIFAACLSASRADAADAWKPHTVRQMNAAGEIRLPAKRQIVTERWNRVVAVPYLVYATEKDRLLMLVACDYPHRPMLMTSDDRGATWTEPRPLLDEKGKPGKGVHTGLAYLGRGELTAAGGDGGNRRWFSHDYGATWETAPLEPLPSGRPWFVWDPPLVERDKATGDVTRLWETGYSMNEQVYYSAKDGHYQQGLLRCSTDRGRTWNAPVAVPQWLDMGEIALLRAANGALAAACRTAIPPQFKGKSLDHYEGIGVSISKDDGKTWSNVKKLYDYGRHHPSLVLMPSGDIVMTHVVRKGYTDAPDGFPRFGIEAIVSHDNGETWDLDHRYILDCWTGNRKQADPNAREDRPGPQPFWASCQSTSTVLLPDGSLLTAFGTGYRSQPDAKNLPSPRDVGVVLWRLGDRPLDADRTIRDAPPNSATRNVMDPTEKK